MTTIDLALFPCLRQRQPLARLNRLVKLHDDIMPHMVATATGCEFKEAGALLVFLTVNQLAEPILLVYHVDHLDGPPILSRYLTDGFPDMPIHCDVCGEVITDKASLLYGYTFRLIKEVDFTVNTDNE